MRGENGEILLQLSLKLQDFWIEWPGRSTHFILLYTFFSPSPFRESCISYKKMHVGCQVKQTLRLDFTIICPKHKMIVFYSKDA
jgi:hypothetical protein